MIYDCKICNLSYKNKQGFNIHNNSLRHKQNLECIERNKKMKYGCDLCKYYTNIKCNFEIHTKTKKHMNGSGIQYF